MKSSKHILFKISLVSFLTINFNFLSQSFADTKPTISGISSGAFMAVQMGTIFSSQISGVASVAGGYFYCAENYMQERLKIIGASTKEFLLFTPTESFYETSINTIINPGEGFYGSYGSQPMFTPTDRNPIYQAVHVCMQNPEQGLMPRLQVAYSQDKIEDPENLRNQKVLIYQGNQDTVVNPKMADVLKNYYLENNGDEKNIKVVKKDGGHTFPTNKEGLNECTNQSVPYVSSCQYDLAQDIFSHLLDIPKIEKSEPVKEHLYIVNLNLKKNSEFEARNKVITSVEHLTQPVSSVSTYGYMYASDFCLNNPDSCQLHVALHGCEMSDSFDHEFDLLYQKQISTYRVTGMRSRLDLSQNLINFFDSRNLPTIEKRKLKYGTLRFALNSGYIDYAEKNNLIILFPQTWIGIDNYPRNPKGCWDWYGWTGSNYATNKGSETAWLMSYINQIKHEPKSFILEKIKPAFDKIKSETH